MSSNTIEKVPSVALMEYKVFFKSLGISQYEATTVESLPSKLKGCPQY